MRNPATSKSNGFNASPGLRYTHRSSIYVSRAVRGHAVPVRPAVAPVMSEPMPYAEETSILKAAQAARDALPSISKPASHSFAKPQSSLASGKGLLSVAPRETRIAGPPSVPRQQFGASLFRPDSSVPKPKGALRRLLSKSGE